MRISHWGLPVVCVPVLLAAGGCYSYPYSPYGPGYYGGVYSTPPAGIVQPGTPYAPPGGFQPGLQSNPGQYPTEVQPGDSWQQPSGPSGFPSDPPSFDSNNNNRPPDGNLVPLPTDPTTPSFSNPEPFNSTPQPFDSNAEPFNSNEPYRSNQPFDGGQQYDPPRNNSTFDTDGAVPFGTDGVQHTPSRQSFQSVNQVQQASHQNEVFQQPVKADKVVTRHLAATTARTETPEPSPFSYDRKAYRWLRGVVDFDAKDQTWNIIYSIDPDPSDPYGGSITLVDDALLSGLKDDDRVLVQGRVDKNSYDRFGKPQYRVEHLGRIVPD